MTTLREAREARRWSVADLKRESGVNHSTICDLEEGKSTPRYETADKLSAALGLDPTEIENFCPPVRNTGQEFSDPIGHALKLARRTLEDVCAKLGMSEATVNAWRRGGYKPWRDNLERFAEEIDQWWLLSAIPSRPRWMSMTCSCCEASTFVEPGAMRSMIKAGIHQDALIDEEAGLGTYTCQPCSARKNITAFVKRKSSPSLKAQGRRLYREHGKEAQPRAVEASARARAGKPLSPEHRLKLSATETAVMIKGKLALCRICETWALSRETDGPRETHCYCGSLFRSEHPELGVAAYPPPLQVKYPHGGTPETMWELTWRHVVKGESLTQKKGGKKSRSELVSELNINQIWALDWVHFVLDHLPVDGRGGKRLTKQAEILLWKAEGLGYHLTASGEQYKGHLAEINSRNGMRSENARIVWNALPDGPPGLLRRELSDITGMRKTRLWTAIRGLGDQVGRAGASRSLTNPPRYWKVKDSVSLPDQ